MPSPNTVRDTPVGLAGDRARETLEFAYVVRFEDYVHRHLLWREKRRVVYSRTGSNGRFEFDAVKSDVPQAFVENVFSFDSMDTNAFTDLTYDRLLAIAAQPADRRRLWRRSCLERAGSDAKAERLRGMLKSVDSRGLGRS